MKTIQCYFHEGCWMIDDGTWHPVHADFNECEEIQSLLEKQYPDCVVLVHQ